MICYDENDTGDAGLTPITYPVVGGPLHSLRVRCHTLRWDWGTDGFYAFGFLPDTVPPTAGYRWVGAGDPAYTEEARRLDHAYLALLERILTSPECYDDTEEAA